MANQDNKSNRFDDGIPDPTADDNDLDMGDDPRPQQGYVGQLVQDGDGDIDVIDDESTMVASDQGFASDEDEPAEEAAMHIIDEP